MKLEPCPGCGAHLVLQSAEWASPCWEHPFRDGKTECVLVTVVMPNLPEYIAQWDALPRPASGGLEGAVRAIRKLHDEWDGDIGRGALSLAEATLRALPDSGEVERLCIKPTHEAADAFWNYWRENGETHRHGYYESTWGAINAAIAVSGISPHTTPEEKP